MLAHTGFVGRVGQPLLSQTALTPTFPSAGTNGVTWLLKTSNNGKLSNLVDGRSSTTVVVLKRNTFLANEVIFQDSTQNLSGMRFNTTDTYRMRLRTTAGTPGVTGNSDLTVLPTLDLAQVVYSTDLEAGYAKSMVNGTLDTASMTTTNTLIDFTNGVDWSIFASDSGGAIGDFNVHSIYWIANNAVDLGIQANRDKFWSGGFPVDAGADGSGYFGAVPQVYYNLNHQTITDWNNGTNLGNGGEFARQGPVFTDTGNL